MDDSTMHKLIEATAHAVIDAAEAKRCLGSQDANAALFRGDANGLCKALRIIDPSRFAEVVFDETWAKQVNGPQSRVTRSRQRR